MTNPALDRFITRVRQVRRISFADLRRLRRDVLPGGIGSREEAETLIALDPHLERADTGWLPFLAASIRALVVTPEGKVDPEAAAWLVPALSRANPKTALIIAREVARGMDEVDGVLLALAKRRPRARTMSQPVSTPLPAEDLCPT